MNVPVAGVDIVGPLPAGLQKVAAIAAAASAPEQAGALVRLVCALQVQAAMATHGLDPARA